MYETTLTIGPTGKEASPAYQGRSLSLAMAGHVA